MDLGSWATLSRDGRGCGCAHDKMITEVHPHHIDGHTTLAVARKSNFSKEATMNVLKVAIVGLALISANTVRADVIADWNNTAMDVMKAVNVAGNPWTRSMALVNVSMSDAVNSVQNRYSRYVPELPTDPNASAEAAAAAAAREILMRQYPGQKE